MAEGNESGLTHIVTLRDIYNKVQDTHDKVIVQGETIERLGRAQDEMVRQSGQEMEKIRAEQSGMRGLITSLQLDRAKALGMAAAVSFIASGGTFGIGFLVVSK